jgi:hypothetical protein
MKIKPIPGTIELLIGFLAVLPVTMLYFYLLGELARVDLANWQSRRYAPGPRAESDRGGECRR